MRRSITIASQAERERRVVQKAPWIFLLLPHCGAVVQPTEDVARVDAASDALVLIADADSTTDDSIPPDAARLRRTSVVRLTNQLTTLGVTFAPRGAVPARDELPEVVAGCRVEDVRHSNIVDAGSVTIRSATGEQALQRWSVRNNEYTILEMLPRATPGMQYTLTATGSAEFPAFSLGCSIPEAMPALTEPPNDAMLEYRENVSLSFRWPAQPGDDLVRVVLSGGNAAATGDIRIDCVAPISQGQLTVPPEAVRLLRDYPRFRGISASRFRRANIVGGDAPIEMQCGNRSPWDVSFR